MAHSLRFLFLLLMCFCIASGIGQVPLISLPDLTSITFHEQSGAIYQHTYGVNDVALSTQLPGQLNSGNRDFEGVADREFYDVFYSDADGTFNSNGEFVSVECRYDYSTGGGALNINEVEFHFGAGYSIYGSYVTSFVSNGNTYDPESPEWAADCNLVTLSALGNTENTTIRLRLTIGILDAPSTIVEETCSQSGYEVMVGNILYNETNPVGTELLTAANGCDSLVYVDLTFNEQYAQDMNYSGCSGDGYSIVVGNNLYNEANPSGIEMLMTQENCDSTIIVDLVYNPYYDYEINYQGCEGDGYEVIVNGIVYRESNPDGTEIMMTTNGCDSIVTIYLAFAPASYSEINYIGCSGDPYEVVVNGTTYDEANPVGEEYLVNQYGCDSIVTIDLVFNAVDTVDVTYTSCSGSGYAIVINGTSYDESHPSGTEWLTDVEGCDSIIQVSLTFLQPISQDITYTGCSGDGYSILINGTTYDESNPNGQEMLTATNGCDSIVTVALSFLPGFTVNEFHSSCQGSGFSLIINGALYDENNPSGVEVFTSQTGCDSIVNIQLDFFPGFLGTESYSGCTGDGYAVTVNGTVYNELNPSGVEMLISQNGCDSIVTINLLFLDMVSVMESYTGCTGDGYALVINGNVYDEANPSGVEMIEGTLGCDTTVTIQLVFRPIRSAYISYVGCVGDDYEVVVNGTLYNSSNPQGTEILTAQNGCDSIITIALNFLTATQHDIQYTGCVGDNYSINVNGTVYSESNPTGMEWLTGSNGCDSIVTINMVFGNQFVANEIYTGCEGDGYSIIVNGNLYDELHPVGMENILGVSGCDTLINIDLTFAPASTSSFTYSGCAGDGFGIVVNGTSYDEYHPNGVETMTNSFGCDSVINVDLSFVDVDSSHISYTGCIGDGYAVTINGSTYDESNPIGTEIVQTVDGCDSIIQVALFYEDCVVQDLDCAIYIPNVISPNNDGINDAFSISYAASCEVTGFRIALFDRWGSELYSSTDPSFKWRGDFRGKQLQPGAYVYIAEIYFKDASAPVIRRGDVTLIW